MPGNQLELLCKRQNGRCVYCGCVMAGWDERRPTKDHRVPVWAGGDRRNGNLVAACSQCNDGKGPLPEKLFLQLRGNAAALKEAQEAVHLMLRTLAALAAPAPTAEAIPEWPDAPLVTRFLGL